MTPTQPDTAPAMSGDLVERVEAFARHAKIALAQGGSLIFCQGKTLRPDDLCALLEALTAANARAEAEKVRLQDIIDKWDGDTDHGVASLAEVLDQLITDLRDGWAEEAAVHRARAQAAEAALAVAEGEKARLGAELSDVLTWALTEKAPLREQEIESIRAALRPNTPAEGGGRVQGASVPDDVARLVVAARAVAFSDATPENIRALDTASEAFASRVPWEDEPDVEAGATNDGGER